jgi:hypothetical protein
MTYPFIPVAINPGGGGSATITRPAGENLTTGELVAFDGGQFLRGVSTFSVDLWNVVGVVRASALAGNPVEVYIAHGQIFPVLFGVAPPAIANGQTVFLDSTFGLATLTPPTTTGNVIFKLGVLIGGDGINLTPEVNFNPQYISRIP